MNVKLNEVDTNKKNVSKTGKTLFSILIGPVLFTLLIWMLPKSDFSFAARGAIGTVVWMASWWITRPVHIGITSLLPIILNALFNFIPMKDVLPNYASEIIMLLLGANIITISWSASGLDKRIALKALCLIGTSLKQQIIVWFGISVVLSMFLPNTIVCAVLTPVAIAMLKFIGEEDFVNSEIATVILLAVAWGAGLGGFGSPIGGSMNLVAISYIEELIGREYMYVTWMIRMFPMIIIVPAVNIAYLFMMKTEVKQLKGTKDFFNEQYSKMGSMSIAENWSLWLFLLATTLAFVRPLYASILPGLKPAFVFLVFGFLAFLVPNGKGDSLVKWDYVSKRLMWGLFYLFAGGMAVGKMIMVSGAADGMANILTGMNLGGGIGTVTVFVVLAVFLCNISSNTAAAAISVPIVINVVQKIGLNPIPYIYITAVAFNCAYVLPTSVRAIPVGYGLDPKVLFKRGLGLVFISIITVTIVGYILYKFWPGYSIA